MVTSISQLLLGGIFLWLAGEGVVRGSSSFARRHGISHLVIGLTIVAFGTSAPELFVSLFAVLQNSPAIAIGNIMGSNIANFGLVLGLTAILKPLIVKRSLTKKEIPQLIGVSFLFWIFATSDYTLARWEGAVLLIGIILFLFYCLANARQEKLKATPEENNIPTLNAPFLDWVFMLGGIAGLIGGSKLFVIGAVSIARVLGVSEFLIGLSIVAIGTSLPELAASIVAIIRKKSDLAIGNLVGSNIFNILLILGTVSIIKPLAVPPGSLKLDFWFMLGLTLLLLPLSWTQKKISRLEGLLLLLIYSIYITVITLRG